MMAIDLPRRRFLQGSAALAGAALLDLPLAGMARAAPGSLRDIDHFIIVTKENRSFDHYFGMLSGVRGFDDAKALRLPGGRSVFEQADERNGTLVAPFRLDTRRTNAQRLTQLDHSWQAQHQSWNGRSEE